MFFFVIAVNIPPSADANAALSILLKTIGKLQSAHPDGILIVAGDFNHVNMRTVLPNFYQHVTCLHLGQSDHLSLFLSLAYRPVVKTSAPVVRTTKFWPADATLHLQDCFEHTDWTLYSQQDLEGHTFTVLHYIYKRIFVLIMSL